MKNILFYTIVSIFLFQQLMAAEKSSNEPKKCLTENGCGDEDECNCDCDCACGCECHKYQMGQISTVPDICLPYCPEASHPQEINKLKRTVAVALGTTTTSRSHKKLISPRYFNTDTRNAPKRH